MKEILENLEWLLSVILSACSSVGMWLIGLFVGNLIYGELTMQTTIILFVVSIFLTWGMNELRMEARYRRLLMEAGEQKAREDQKDDQAEALCDHLMEAVYDP